MIDNRIEIYLTAYATSIKNNEWLDARRAYELLIDLNIDKIKRSNGI